MNLLLQTGSLRGLSTVVPSANSGHIEVLGQKYPTDEYSNLTDHMLSHTKRGLHLTKHHPIQIVKQRIVENVQAKYLWNNRSPLFTHIDNIGPVVTHTENFDELLVPGDHVSRRKQDNYFINGKHMLRAHMTCHDRDLIRSGLDAFMTTGDVYRRDTIDKTHYPVFHQMDGVRLFSEVELAEFSRNPKEFKMFSSEELAVPHQSCHTTEAVKMMEFSLKSFLIGIVQALFGKCKYRWVETTFPFTEPSWELEILYNDEWLEVLGCGVLKQSIATKAGATNKMGWAFGLGLERLAMAMYNIPDIRLFWSEDERFLNQFKIDHIHRSIKFEPYSNYSARSRDVAFWLPPGFSDMDFYDLARSILPGDTVEDIKLIDSFKKGDEESHCYRIQYRAWDRHLSVDEANAFHQTLCDAAANTLGITVR